MSPDEQSVCGAWQLAAQELGFRFTPSFSINLDGQSHTFLGLVHGFGGPKGALLAIYEPGHSLSEYPQPDGYHVSLLSASSYCKYERQHFIDTLDDLQWCGPDTERPPWYSGKPWTS
jgi:hypothetical protein